MVTKIVLDAGHGMNTPGKRTPDDEREWSFNNKVLRACEAELRKYQAVQILRVDDPTGKSDVRLSTRTKKANEFDGDVYVSFHHNASTGKWHSGGGTEVYCYNGSSTSSKSDQLAKMLAPKIADAMGLRNRGAKRANFQVLRETKMPAILIEGGFMDSRVDIKAMRNDAKLKAQGVAVAKVLVDFFNLKPIPAPKPKPAAKPSSKEEAIGMITISTPSLNLRASKSLSSKIIKTLPQKSTHRVYAVEGNWYKLDGGYVSNPNKVYARVDLWRFHKVAKGQTLWFIAKKYQTTVNKVKQLNGLRSDVIQVGDNLRVK